MNNDQQKGQSDKGKQAPPAGGDKNLKGKKTGGMDQKQGGDACASKGGSCGTGMDQENEE